MGADRQYESAPEFPSADTDGQKESYDGRAPSLVLTESLLRSAQTASGFRLGFYDELPRAVVEQIFARDALHICCRDRLELRHGFANQPQAALVALRSCQRRSEERRVGKE